MIRLREPTAGTVRFEGVDLATLKPEALRKMRRRMQIIFQDPYGSLDPRMTVGAIIARALDTHGLAKGKARKERIADLLRIVGLDPKYVARYPHEFSGGQRQRIGVARALAVEPEFIVCDEPISALDVSIQAQVLNLLTDLREQLGLTYLFIAHDLSVVKHISDRVAVMYLGKIVEIGPPDIMYCGARASLHAGPPVGRAGSRSRGRAQAQAGDPDRATCRARSTRREGCRFHTRCWLYERLGKPEDAGRSTRRSGSSRATTVRPATSPSRPSSRTWASPTSTRCPFGAGPRESALASIRPQDGGARSEAQTVAVAETVIGSTVLPEDDTDGSNGINDTEPDKG